MPLDKYKTFYDIVVMLTHMDLTKLRSVANELKQFSKVKFKKRKRNRSIKLRKIERSKQRRTKKTVGKIYRTKNGQPYKILASGKAKFLKKR
jgi:hypothetical protein